MNTQLNIFTIQNAMIECGYTQKDLSQKIEVSESAVSQWFSGITLPDYKNLKKLCSVLDIDFATAISKPEQRFVFNFRKSKKATVKIHDKIKAEDMATAIQSIIPYIIEIDGFEKKQEKLYKPRIEDDYYLKISLEFNNKLGNDITVDKLLDYLKNDLNTIIIPVPWGIHKPFCNALQISDKKYKISFLYLNINSKVEDVKFWLLHEIAHIWAPDFNEEEGEIFADAIAGAILFPQASITGIIDTLLTLSKPTDKLKYICDIARIRGIAPYTVYKALLNIENKDVNLNLPDAKQFFMKNRGAERYLNYEQNLDANSYISLCETTYKSNIFSYLKQFINEYDESPHFIRRILNISYEDSINIFRILKHA